jgi:glycosyltransferase involved in cell wall biosynthesis
VRLLLYSHTFWPNIGGVERVSQLLAEALSARGHSIHLVTPTPSSDALWDQAQPYRIWRQPSLPRLLALIARAEVVHGNGASFAAVLPALLLGRPALWTHVAWQLLSVDGLGWADGLPTPLAPSASLAYYKSRLNLLPWLRQCVLLHARRWLAGRIAANVAISQWMLQRQPLPRQQLIPNPVALPAYAWSNPAHRPIPLLFLGRLVSEKGFDVLLHALALLAKQPDPLHPRLLVVGDGPLRQPWQQLAQKLGVADQLEFRGALSGAPLLAALDSCRIGVVPSAWEEPMGLVGVELLAAGLIPVVSQSGGLAENVSCVGRCFPNGDAAALARVLRDLLMQPPHVAWAAVQHHIDRFQPQQIASRYESLYRSIAARSGQRG